MMTLDKGLLRISRLEGLTDGVFAIAMTILVFGLQLPDGTPSTSLPMLLETHILEKLFIYIGSFIILGTQWIGLNFQHAFLTHINRPYLWVNIICLMLICVVPFSASLVVDYPKSPISISFYAINLMCISLGQLAVWYAAHRFHLNNEYYTPIARRLIMMRIMMPPSFYVFALIMAHWNTYIAFFALIIPPFIHMTRSRADSLPIEMQVKLSRKKINKKSS